MFRCVRSIYVNKSFDDRRREKTQRDYRKEIIVRELNTRHVI